MDSFLREAKEHLDNAIRMDAACPRGQLLPGNAMVEAGAAAERLQEYLASLRSISKQRVTVKFLRWYRPLQDQLFVRWDEAVQFAVLRLMLRYTDIDIRHVASAADGSLQEIAIVADDQEIRVVYKETCDG
jgi:hypothetical protein